MKNTVNESKVLFNFITYKQKFRGGTRIIYRTVVGKSILEAGSLEQLKVFVENHVEPTEGTFKD